ncbi:MAG: VCBS repeat-containing protein [Pseudomonadota bacterium]
MAACGPGKDDTARLDPDPGSQRPFEGTHAASEASASILGFQYDSGLQRVMILGDVDGDGLDDLGLGAPTAGGDQTGAVYLFLGPIRGLDQTVSDADAALEGEGPGRYTGANLARAGDLDDDGLNDFLVAAPYAPDAGEYAGKVYLVRGAADPTGLTLLGAWATFIAQGAGDQLGSGLAAGDVDADGVPDVVLGAMYADRRGLDSGAAFLFWGDRTGGTRACGSADVILPGTEGSLAGKVAVGNVFGDGFADVLVGAPESSASEEHGGVVEAYSGAALAAMTAGETPTARASLTTTCAWCSLGQFTGAGEDLDGDGSPDALVVDTFYPSGDSPPGAFYLFPGPIGDGATTAAAASVSILGEHEHAAHIDRMVTDGDLDGDGNVELLIPSACDDEATTYGGAVRVFYGPLTPGVASVFTADAVLLGGAAYDLFGADLSSGGDLDGDGFDDLVVLAGGHDGGGGLRSAAYIFQGGP